MYALGTPASSQNQPSQTQQPVQYAQAATLAQPTAQKQTSTQQPVQVPQPSVQPQPITPVVATVPVQPQAQQFGQPQQPQPAQPRQTTMTQNTAAQRYNQMLQQNAPQAQAVSSGLAQVIEDPVTQAKKKLDAAQAEFRQKVAESGLTRDAGRTSDIINKAAALQAGQTLTPEEFAELENISKTKETFGEGVRDSDFVSLQNYVQALGEADKAKQLAGLTETTSDRQELLSQLVGDRAYGEGQSLFDSLLAGGVQPASQQLGDIREQLITQDILGKQATEEEQRATGARSLEEEEIASAYKDIQDMLDGEGTGKLASQEKAIRDRVQAENLRVKELNNEIDSVLKNKGSIFGDSTAERNLIKKLGLTDSDVQKIQSAGPNVTSDIINKLKEASEQTMTSKDELARLNELYKIGDLTNRQGEQITAQEGDDLGSLINQKADINKDRLQAMIRENTQNANTRKNEINQSALESPIQTYKYGKGISTKNAAIDIYDRMRSGSFKPEADNAEADKVIKNLQNAVNKTQNYYKSQGLKVQPLPSPSSSDIQDAFNAIWENSGVAKYPINNTKLYNGNINTLKAQNPKLYNSIYSSAARMATIKKLAEYNNFFNEFRHNKPR